MNGRELKFREWMPSRSKFHYWGLIDGAFIGATDPKANHQQLTGLKDKNGKDVYEGDIFEIELSHENKPAWVVEWHVVSGSWRVRDLTRRTASITSSSFWTTHAVIGNIYQNPELLSHSVQESKEI